MNNVTVERVGGGPGCDPGLCEPPRQAEWQQARRVRGGEGEGGEAAGPGSGAGSGQQGSANSWTTFVSVAGGTTEQRGGENQENQERGIPVLRQSCLTVILVSSPSCSSSPCWSASSPTSWPPTTATSSAWSGPL